MMVISVQNSFLLLISWYNGHSTVHRERTEAQITIHVYISTGGIIDDDCDVKTTTTIIIIIIIIIQFFVYLRADSNVDSSVTN
jgi:hypothetical protein